MNGKTAKKLKAIARKSSNPVKAYNILKELYNNLDKTLDEIAILK